MRSGVAATVRYISFDAWWQVFKRLARDAGLPLVGDRSAYRDYYEDGDAPATAVDEEMRGLMGRRVASPKEGRT